jgi:hypothetical protein
MSDIREGFFGDLRDQRYRGAPTPADFIPRTAETEAVEDSYADSLPQSYVHYCMNRNVSPDDALLRWKEADFYRNYTSSILRRIISVDAGESYIPLMISMYKRIVGQPP